MKRTRTALLFGSLLAIACGGRIFDADGGTSNPDGAPNPPPTPTPTTTTPDPPPWPPPPIGPDGGPTPIFDAGPQPPPPPPLCTPMSGSGWASMNSCGVTEQWSCGNTKYMVECSCPSKQCTCVQFGQSKWQVAYPNGCPSCAYSGKQLAQLCGFPSL